MCGIALVACVTVADEAYITRPAHGDRSPWPDAVDVAASSEHKRAMNLLLGLTTRGPDHLGTAEVTTAAGSCRLQLAGSLLQLRGLQHGISPCTSEQGHVLCFNGEVFGGLNVSHGENDGACLLAAVATCDEFVPDVLSRLRGPWALILWDPLQQRLWFGRDVLGRRSLLVHWPDSTEPRLLLSSVSQLAATQPTGAAAPGPVAPAASGAALDAPAASRDGGNAACAGVTTHGAAGPASVAAATLAARPSGPAAVPTAGPSGECGRAGRGAGGCEEDKDEPTGSDGFWTELPPGLYSVSFQRFGAGPLPGEELLKAAAAGTRAGASSGSVAEHPQVYRTFTLVGSGGSGQSGSELRVERHAWRDALLLELETYQRAESLSPEAVPGSSDVATATRAVVASAPASTAAAGEAVDGGSGGEVAEAAGTCPDGTSDMVTGVVVGRPINCWVPLVRLGKGLVASAEDGAALALLNVLLAAVRIRCACVEARSPHPSAAYASAAAEAMTMAAAGHGTSPHWPSWRADNPQEYRLPPPSLSAATTRLADGNVSCIGGGGGFADGVADDPSQASPPSAIPQLEAVPVMILFSGGVDSVLLAALAHQALPLHVPIDLSNVCFAGGTSPDREAARAALEELTAACPGRPWRLLEVDATLEDVDRHRSRLLSLLRPAHTVMDLNIGAALWLAVSGQGSLRRPAIATGVPDPCPAAAAPSSALSTNTSSLPVSTTNSTAAATTNGSIIHECYGSPARVVLLGHGADEQCGGYGRHRTRFRTSGWAGLAAELEVDVRRLWLRNLGRDDRLVSDWGREARHPFLDEDVMALLLRARLDSILDMSLPAGEGDKRVLRRALALLGLPEAARRVKRAIQFGSRIGKVSNRRDFGSNRAANKKNAGGVQLQDVSRTAAEAAAAAWVKPVKDQRL